MSAEVVVDARFRGPPSSANGGYVCGILAGRLPPGAVTVTLRRPIPLDRTLRVQAAEGDGLALVDPQADDAPVGGQVLVVAKPAADVDLGAVPPVSRERARTARPDEALLVRHPFPGCFGCGTEREQSEAVALHVGPLGGGVWATSWTPGTGLPHERNGDLTSEVVWTALDCPSSFAAVPAGSEPHVLGRLEGSVAAPVRVGEEVIVLSWALGHEGRKRWGATAIVGTGGDLRALARATWVALA